MAKKIAKAAPVKSKKAAPAKIKKTTSAPSAPKAKPAAKATAKPAAKPAPIGKKEAAPEQRTGTAKVLKAPPKPVVLNREQLDLRDQLMQMRENLRKEIQAEVRGARDRDLDHITDTSDIAADAAEGELAFRLAETESVEVEEIDKAIEKLDTGTYGICETCAEPINPERMKFLPFATMCIKCQELAEIRRKEKEDEGLDDLAEGEAASDDA
jgi:RNA polymerase-binding protein DksA